MLENKEIVKERYGHDREHRNQPEGAPSGQSWGNLNIKIKNDSNGTIH